MHVSNNDVQIAHYKLTERKDELSVERKKLEDARQAADDSHKKWMQAMNRERNLQRFCEKTQTKHDYGTRTADAAKSLCTSQ
jgi:hypothetical protein